MAEPRDLRGEMRAPKRALTSGLLADLLGGMNDYAQREDRSMPMGKANPPLSILANLLQLSDYAKTADRVSYGEPLTSGKGMTTAMRPETANVAANMLPFGMLKPGATMGLMGALGGAVDTGAVNAAAGALPRQTVRNAQRMAYPDIYKDPRELVREAASRVEAEDPLLRQLFGVTRDDLYEIGGKGMRAGTTTERPYKAAAKPKGAASMEGVMVPENTNRLVDLIAEAMNVPKLHEPMASWYVMDPLFAEFKRIHGDNAVKAYNQFNALTGMASPGSEVLTELNRGTAANYLATQGRFKQFEDLGGMAESKRGKKYPEDMRAIIGHPYHKTAQMPAMRTYLEQGAVDMNSAKVPSYIQASGVPETGFQSNHMVSDAHHSRIIGLADTRNPIFKKGVEEVPKASASVPEAVSMQPWWENEISIPTGHSSVGAQGVVWGAGSGATGVTSPIGAPKLELLAKQIGKAAKRYNISPEKARDLIIQGKAYAGAAAGAAVIGSQYGDGSD